jgi:hypothetical protein
MIAVTPRKFTFVHGAAYFILGTLGLLPLIAVGNYPNIVEIVLGMNPVFSIGHLALGLALMYAANRSYPEFTSLNRIMAAGFAVLALVALFGSGLNVMAMMIHLASAAASAYLGWMMPRELMRVGLPTRAH